MIVYACPHNNRAVCENFVLQVPATTRVISGLCSNALANESAKAAFALSFDSPVMAAFVLAFAFDSSAFALAFDSNAFD